MYEDVIIDYNDTKLDGVIESRPMPIVDYDYTKYAFAFCECPLPLDYAIPIKRIPGKSGWQKFKCLDCGLEGEMYLS